MKLVLIRGLPGSGKSTIAKALYKAGFDWFEADTYHLNDEGDYCYDPANVKEAHEWCQRETFKALANGKRVVVSNTFTRRFEMEPYFEMAKTFGIEPNILEATGNWPNVHGVPAEVVEKMRQRWEKSSNLEFSGTPAALSPEAPLERRVGALVKTENEMQRRCDKCELWDRDGREHLDLDMHEDDRQGCCRRYPPVRDMDWSVSAPDECQMIDGSCEDFRAWQQPITCGGHWCGEFVKRPNALAKPPGAALCDRSA